MTSTATLTWTLVLTAAVFGEASHVVSGTDARLPMSLTTVIQDLEAEGASCVTTATFLTSKSVRRPDSARLVRSLFGVTGAGDHDGEVDYGTTTAFGKKLGDDSPEDDSEADGGSGLAVACPPCLSTRLGATASEVTSTVVACGGTVVFVADQVDLGRGEGLFDYLGPAVEQLLASRSDGSDKHRRPSTLVVVFNGVTDPKKMAVAQKMWEDAASRMLATIVQAGGVAAKATKLEDVFDRIEYLSAAATDVDMHLCPAGGNISTSESPASRDMAEVATDISDVVNAGLVENLGPMVEMMATVPVKQACPRLTNPVDLAAARLLGPLAQTSLAGCLDSVRSSTGTDGKVLVPDFGALCHAAIRRALDTFDATGKRFQKSPIAKRIRSDLKENLYSELGDIYEVQVGSLEETTFTAFRGRLNKLRISPVLPDQMGEAAEESVRDFARAVKKLQAPQAASHTSWASRASRVSALRGRCREYNTERLQAARAAGQLKPVPRKGVTVGMHWLLPKPFGNDYRQEPHLTHSADDLVFAPVDGITDVAGNEIRSGDWRKSVVPAPTGTEMMYLK